ncbi:MAG: UDP-N-acetylmuramate--L-alanine ligase [Candidatus Staskawiczbacteria bacterium]|nr:UDP-N-acetylmuramate--L-alanine ligase [Candidatus Staskawiczbacteria bacterium]
MKIHLIGVGGIGVSALAQYYLSKGHEVSGSDLVASEITDFLKEKGVKIFIGNSAENVKENLDLVVYSPAVKKDNPELKFYKEKGVECLSYPEALGDLTKEYYTIAIAGAHGKSTTTAMLALVLAKAGLDPTVIVGTKVKEFGNSNFREGKGKFLVIEACEYDSSFLHYSPKIIVVTNVDKEHLDYFKTFSNVKKAFRDFIMRLSDDGFLVFNGDDKNLSVIARSFGRRSNLDSRFRGNDKNQRLLRFARNDGEAKKLRKILKVPGEHNISNALAVLQVARILGIPDELSFSALSEFEGTWRRFEVKEGKAGDKKITVVSDYGHHPSEISATLKAAREKYPDKTIWCVFQPHQHQRTYYLFNDFVKTFRKAQTDKIIIIDIYDVAGRETKKINSEVSSEKLVKKISKENILYFSLSATESYVKKNIKSDDVLIIMGAGDIYKLADKF